MIAPTLLLFVQCYTPSDQQQGWKRVDIPDGAPALAAPPDVEQFRSGEPFTLWLVAESGGRAWESRGKSEATFDPDLPMALSVPEWNRLEVEFARPLDGAEVDITGEEHPWTSWSTPLWQKRRVSDDRIRLAWNEPKIGRIRMVVHHHLRREPVILRWRAGRETHLAAEPWIPKRFRSPRVLFYLQPAGRAIELCPAPQQPLGVRAESLAPWVAPPEPAYLNKAGLRLR